MRCASVVFFDVMAGYQSGGRVTSDVVRGMSVTDFTTVGYIAKSEENAYYVVFHWV